MRPRSAPTHDAPARRPAVTRADARADERRRFTDAAARAAEAELPALADTTDAPELALMQRALAACVAFCATDEGSDEHYAAIKQLWAVAEAVGG
jgi:hypothetical protein